MSLTGKAVWLTGASSGIGEALVPALLDAGVRLTISARRADALADVAARHPGASLHVLPLDVTDREAVHRAASDVRAQWGHIDIALFNAGTHIPVQAQTWSADDFRALIDVNYMSLVYGVEAVLPDMLARRQGHIAGVASVAGYRALPTAAAYGASKAAAILMLDALRFDVERQGIAVSVINPGFVRTPLTDRNRFHMPGIIDAPRAAALIVRGLEHRAREIHFPALFSWTMKLLRVLPYPLYHRLVMWNTPE
ncbi:MAG: SDR family NAD(P)-dependent oxidoreductase [Acidobacteria bacterium]|nr:SDR family NAD(P)-dependent oxidoreductase [Acidobacteriota bacterium]